jgi:DNA-binding CsgD family transcriptional regulator
LLTRGKTAKESAKILNVSHRTIEHRLEKMRAKLNAASKSELIDKVLGFFA